MTTPSQRINLLPDKHLRSARVDPFRAGMLVIANAVERALICAGITKDEAAYQLGFAKGSRSGQISRWTTARESANTGKLWMLTTPQDVPGRATRFQQEYVLALADAAGMSVATEIAAIELPSDGGLAVATKVILRSA